MMELSRNVQNRVVMKTEYRPLWLLWLIPILLFGISVATLSSLEVGREWLREEGGQVLEWWLLTTLAGVAVLPLLFRLMPGLADRGYGLARTAGLLMVGFVFWFLASIGFLRNDPGAMTFAWLVVMGMSGLVWLQWPNRPSGDDLRAWFREQLPLIIITEVLFFVAFFAWAYIQAHNPELTSTEKPMEMAFINGVRNSATFPPKDPWLSGYAISYYYFGYVLAAGLSDLSGVTTGMGFNLMNALMFALTASGALSVGYNLVRSVGRLERWRVGTRSAALGTGLLAATLIVLSGHLATLLIELPYRGYASNIPLVKSIISDEYFDWWDVKGRSELFPDRDNDGVLDWDDDPIAIEDGWEGGWWWWVHSRLVRDRNLSGAESGTQPIAEIPHFSFILSDNHPHVLGLPFTLLMIGLAAGLVLRGDPLGRWEVVVYAIFVGGMIFLNAWDAVYLLIIVAAAVLRRLIRNGTGMLTGWSPLIRVVSLQERVEMNYLLAGPVYVGLLVFLIWHGVGMGESTPWLAGLIVQLLVAAILTPVLTLIVNWMLDDNDWAGVAQFGVALFGLFYILYLPWITSFSSQANGFFPNIVHPTRGQQVFLQFGLQGLLIGPFIIMQLQRGGKRLNWGLFVWFVMIGGIVLLLVPVVSAVFINWQCPVAGEKWGQVERFSEWACQARTSLFGSIDNQSTGSLAWEVLARRLEWAGISELIMLMLIGAVLMRLFPRDPGHQALVINFSPNVGIALLLVAAGATAVLIPDLMFLRDNFSQRINTVFKLYYQGWVLLSMGAAYAVYAVLSGDEALQIEPRPRPDVSWRAVYGLGAAVLLFAGLLFPYFAIKDRTQREPGRLAARACVEEGREDCHPEAPLTLDGSYTLVGRINRDDYEAMQCLAELEPRQNDAVLVEMHSGAYSPEKGRFSMFTGIPTLLGWDNHEHQWRGLDNYYQVVRGEDRKRDIDRLYQLPADNWAEVMTIVDRYGIDYVVVGDTEIRQYRGASGDAPGLEKFAVLLDPVCQSGQTAVYRVSPE